MRILHHKYGQEIIWKKSFLVLPDLVSHIKYLKEVVQCSSESPIILPDPNVEIVTDASEFMVASYDSFNKKIVVPLPVGIRDESSTLRETYGVYIALLNRIDVIQEKSVRVLIDNLGTSTVLMRNGSKLKKLNDIVYSIIKLTVKYKISLVVKWLRRSVDAIQFADDLSKITEVDRWIFDRELLFFTFKKLKLPLPTLDLLADNQNCICNKYFSRFKDAFSLGNNWLNQPYYKLSNNVCYLNPPYRGDYLMVAIDHFITKQLYGYILLPKWPLAPWYTLVITHASIIIEFVDGYKYFKSPDYMTNRLTKHWDIILVYFGIKSCSVVKKYYIYNELTMTFKTTGGSLCLH